MGASSVLMMSKSIRHKITFHRRIFGEGSGPFQFTLCFVPTGSCFWVAVLNGNVVGIVAARGNEEDNTVELRRMSVDSKYRGKGIAKALGRKVLEFAVVNNYSSVVLGTTAVKVAAHKLYESLGFKHVGVVEHYSLPGMTHSILEQLFFQLRYHRYCLQLREE